ncbi:MAG TPA: flippase [Candidatus Gracilibacteria bacterium]|nr:flippase [Candidatus Gracilibacteria bacterium]
MSVARKILSNTIWQIIGRFSMAALAIITLKIATNYLSIEGYGQYAVTYEFLAFFSIAADMGLFTIAITEMSKDEKKIPKIIGNILTLRTIFVVFMMLVAIGAVFMIPKYSGSLIPLGVSIATLSIFFTITNGTITSVLQTKLKMHIASMAQILGKVIMILGMLFVAYYLFPQNPGEMQIGSIQALSNEALPVQPRDLSIPFYGMIIAGVVGNFAMLLFTYFNVRRITPLVFQFDLEFCKEILKKSLPYGVALILNTIYFRIDSILLSLIKDAQEVGIYAVAMRIIDAVSIIPLFFMNSVLPVLTRSMSEKNTEKSRTIIRHSFDFLSALAFPFLIGAFALAYPLIAIVSSPAFLSRLDEGFYGSDIALKILMFAMALQFLSTLFMFILLSLDKQKKILYINLAAVIFNIIGNILIIPTYGFRGSAFISVLSAAIILTLSARTAYKHFKFSLNPFTTIKIIASSIVMGLFVYYAQPLSFQYMQNAGLLVLIPLAGILYFSLLILTKALTPSMLKLLKKSDSDIASL